MSLVGIVLLLIISLLCAASVLVIADNVRYVPDWKWYDTVQLFICLVLIFHVVSFGYTNHLKAENEVLERQVDSLSNDIEYLDRWLEMERTFPTKTETEVYDYALVLDTVVSVDTLYVPIKRKQQKTKATKDISKPAQVKE